MKNFKSFVSEATATKIFRKSYKNPMGLTVTAIKEAKKLRNLDHDKNDMQSNRRKQMKKEDMDEMFTDMDHKSDAELKKIARSTHPHAARAMTALRQRGVKIKNPATGKKEDMDEMQTASIEEKQKGVDGKVCWDGYKRMGTKKKGGKTVDNCVKVKEDDIEEATPTSTGDVVGTGDDVADWKTKKRKKFTVTKRYIEVAGKRKKLVR